MLFYFFLHYVFTLANFFVSFLFSLFLSSFVYLLFFPFIPIFPYIFSFIRLPTSLSQILLYFLFIYPLPPVKHAHVARPSLLRLPDLSLPCFHYPISFLPSHLAPSFRPSFPLHSSCSSFPPFLVICFFQLACFFPLLYNLLVMCNHLFFLSPFHFFFYFSYFFFQNFFLFFNFFIASFCFSVYSFFSTLLFSYFFFLFHQIYLSLIEQHFIPPFLIFLSVFMVFLLFLIIEHHFVIIFCFCVIIFVSFLSISLPYAFCNLF